jgi:hypothetical protein
MGVASGAIAAAVLLSPSIASALSIEQAIKNCRQTVWQTFHASMHAKQKR